MKHTMLLPSFISVTPATTQPQFKKSTFFFHIETVSLWQSGFPQWSRPWGVANISLRHMATVEKMAQKRRVTTSDHAAWTASSFCSLGAELCWHEMSSLFWQLEKERGSVLSGRRRNSATQSDNTENTFTSDKLPHPWPPTISSPPFPYLLWKQSESDKFGFTSLCVWMSLEEIQVLEEKRKSLCLNR